MYFSTTNYFEDVQKNCVSFLNQNYDYCYLSAMHNKIKSGAKSDIIVVGSSHAMNGIDEKQFEPEFSITNFSISSQDIYYDFKHLEMILCNSSTLPKAVVINLGYYMLYQDLSRSTNFSSIISRTYMPLFNDGHHLDCKVANLWENIEKNNSRMLDISEKNWIDWWCKQYIIEQGGYYTNTFKRESNNILGVKKIKWSEINHTEKEEYVRHRVVEGHNKHIQYKDSRIENEKTLHKIIKLITESGAIPIIWITPYTNIYMEHINPQYKKDIIDVLNTFSENVFLFDVNDYEGLFSDNDFIDSDHLNLTGAEKASQLLKQYISELLYNTP